MLTGSAVSWTIITAHPAPPEPAADPSPATVPLEITSTPAGAGITFDGQARGTTPATVAAGPGQHNVAVEAQDAIAETRTLEVDPSGSSLSVSLWRSRPDITYLKPPLPGALLSDAVFLQDGRLALHIALPDGERQAWTLDPDAHFSSQRLGEITVHGLLAVRPDGQVIAVLRPRTDAVASSGTAVFSDRVVAGEVWVLPTSAGASPEHVWTTPEPAEDLVDLDWAPDGQHLIVVSSQSRVGGAARTTIRWLDVNTGEAQDLALLPSDVAPATYVWSPDGQTVGFVVHTASLAAVCTLSVAGDFRYLGDLGHDGLLGPPVAPVAWAPDGRVLYGALLGQAPSSNSSLPFSQNPAGLFLANPADAPGIDPAPPESTPAPFTTPASSSSSGSAASSSSSPSRSGPSFPLLTQDQANGLFDGFLLHGFLSATDGLRRGFQRLIDDANLVTNTAPDWTYQQSTVVALQRAVQVMSDSVLALLIFWLGLNVLLRPNLGGSYLESMRPCRAWCSASGWRIRPGTGPRWRSI